MPRQAPPTNRGRKFPAEPLTDEEVRALLAAASNDNASGIRARALIGVLFGAGLRIAEALALYPRDVDTRAGSLLVRHGKGDKSRRAGFDEYAGALLDLWMAQRRGLGLTPRHPVFATYTKGNVGSPLHQEYVRALLPRLAARAGIDKRVHPHGLRHSLAFDLAQRGVPVHQIQAQFGHSSLAVTSRYVSHLAPTAVIDVMRAHDWRTPERNGAR